MKIKGEWAGPCPHCGAANSCCETAQGRRQDADSLARLVDRQSRHITELKQMLQEAMAVVEDLRKGVPL